MLLHPADLVIYRRRVPTGGLLRLPFDSRRIRMASGTWRRAHRRQTTFTVHHTPGHAPGHVCSSVAAVMIGGDLLFASIGRTDLPLSNPEAMEVSLGIVATFDTELAVYPGHGPPRASETSGTNRFWGAGTRTYK